MEGVDVFRLVQWDESLAQEVFVLLLQWQSKAVDDAAENLQQLGHPIMLTVLIPAKARLGRARGRGGGREESWLERGLDSHKCVENVVDRATNEGAVRHEFAVHAVQDRFQVVSLARVLRVEQSEELHKESVRARESERKSE